MSRSNSTSKSDLPRIQKYGFVSSLIKYLFGVLLQKGNHGQLIRYSRTFLLTRCSTVVHHSIMTHDTQTFHIVPVDVYPLEDPEYCSTHALPAVYTVAWGTSAAAADNT